MHEHTPERWLPIDGTDGKYEVSNLGRVRSFAKKNPRILSAARHGDGYRSVAIYYNGKSRTRMVHHLVLDAFGDPRPSTEHETRHLNNDRGDNRAANLAWATKEENNADKVRSGGAKGGKGSCLAPDQVREIRHLAAEGNGLKAIGEKFGVTALTVWEIKTRRTWRTLVT